MSFLAYWVLVLVIYGSIAAALVYFAIKKTRLFMTLLGIAAILGSLPLGFFFEIGLNGCCGAPSTGREGWGYALGILVGAAGVALIILSGKLKKPGRRQR